MNIKDLGKEDYTMYNLCVDSMTKDYLAFFWFIAIFSSFIYLDAIVSGISALTIAGLVIFLALLFFNLFQFTAKVNHLKKLYAIDKGFSLLK
jgi:hypothetical protein